MFIKYRRSFFLVFMAFSLLFFSQAFSLAFFPMAVRADDSLVLSPQYGVRWYSGYQFRVCAPSVTDYTNCSYFKSDQLTGAKLRTYDTLDLHIASGGVVNQTNVSVRIVSFTSLPVITNPSSGWSTVSLIDYEMNSNPISSFKFGVDRIISIPVSDLLSGDIVDDRYYAVLVSTLAADSATFSRSVPEPTPTPTVSPSPVPSPVPSSVPGATPSPTLDDYNFWTYCYDQTIKEGGSSSGTVKLRFVPSSVADFSDSVHNYVYTYNIKIPFRIATNFTGIGYVDSHYGFDLDYGIMGVDGYGSASGQAANINKMVDFSNPWIESSDGISFNASLTQQYGYGFDVFNVPLDNCTSQEFYFCFDMYVSLSATGQLTNFGDYVDIMLSGITYDNIESTKVSDTQSEDILGQIRDEQAKQDQIENEHYQEEQDKISEAEGSITDGASQLTDTLSSWEIFTMPFKIVQDFAGAIASDGSTGLTFPSFTLMGQQLWPSYTFDLQVIAEKFPVLYNALHLITGIMVVSWFIHYCWRKWHILMDDDMPEDT